MLNTLLKSAGAALLVTLAACAEENAAAVAQQQLQNQNASPAGTAATRQGSTPQIPADRGRLIEEAVSAVRETQNALTAIDRNDRAGAIAALERATGKLEILLAREPSLALAPVDVGIVNFDVLADAQDVRRLREQAEEAIERGRLQEARRIISGLASEMVISVSHLPLATYPDAIKAAARRLDEGKMQEAKEVLQTALSTLVVRETVFPLPILRAQEAIDAAKALAEKPNRSQAEGDRLRTLLESARRELRFAQTLGYSSEENLRDLIAEIDRIEARTEGQKHGRGFFDRIDRLFETASQSSQRPAR